MHALVDIEHVSLFLPGDAGQAPVLHDIVWTVERGGHCALLGPNGRMNYYYSLYRATYEDFAVRHRNGNNETKLQLLYTQLVVGSVGMSMHWLNDKPEEPVETVADVLFGLIKANL